MAADVPGAVWPQSRTPVRKRKQKNSVQVLQIPKIVVPLQRN